MISQHRCFYMMLNVKTINVDHFGLFPVLLLVCVCVCMCVRTHAQCVWRWWGSEQLWEGPVLHPGEAGSPCVLCSFHQLIFWAFSRLCPPPCQWSAGSQVCGIASSFLFVYIFALWDFHTMHFYSTGSHPRTPPRSGSFMWVLRIKPGSSGLCSNTWSAELSCQSLLCMF